MDKDTLREYCWYNNRKWSDDFYGAAVKKAKYTLANDAEYLESKTRKERKAQIEGKVISKQFFSIMNLVNYYFYSDNIGEEGRYQEYDAESDSGTIAQDHSAAIHDDGEMIFSREWNGMYTQREIDYLDDYYARLEESFL